MALYSQLLTVQILKNDVQVLILRLSYFVITVNDILKVEMLVNLKYSKKYSSWYFLFGTLYANAERMDYTTARVNEIELLFFSICLIVNHVVLVSCQSADLDLFFYTSCLASQFNWYKNLKNVAQWHWFFFLSI